MGVGAPEYLAPEAILGFGYTRCVDWWALGVVMHELVVGPLPFGSSLKHAKHQGALDQIKKTITHLKSTKVVKSHTELEEFPLLFREIVDKSLDFSKSQADPASVSLMCGLLERAPELRLGSSTRDAHDIMDHWYFEDFDWKDLASQRLEPPYVPILQDAQQNWQFHDPTPILDCSFDAVCSLDTDASDDDIYDDK